MATIQYARLYPDVTQLQAKDGHNLTAGWVEVYLAGTDDPAITYADFNGTRNPQRIVVDDNGRFCAIVDKSKAYRVEVYDADGMLQWTTEPVWCTGNAGAGMSVTRVVSTDGSIAVEENIDGSERTYDLSIAPSDSDEFLEWIKCSEEDCGSTWYPVYQAGTMETEAGQGIKVHAGQLYHFTNTFYVDPNGTGINYDTFKAIMYCNDEIVDVRDFDIDSSLNDSVMCEFSTDLIPEADGVVYYKLTIPSTCEVTAEVQCHRIYSGINAVPDTCATKQWVEETFNFDLSSKISYSALEYNGYGNISAINGSAIAGGVDSSVVSSIASSYAQSAISSISGWSGDFSSISSKIDWSSSGVFQPSGDYAYNSSLSSKADQSAFEQCCDEVHSALDEKLDKSASSEFQPSGQYVYESAYSSFSSEVTNNISSLSSNVSGISADMSAYVPFSGLEGEGGKVTGISGSAFKGHEYTGINPVVVDNTADTIAVEHRTLCVDSTMTAYNSGSSAVIGVNVAGLDLSSKMDASASSLFYPMDNPSGYITGVDLTPYQLTADMSAYAHESSLSSKLDASASSNFMSTSERADYLPASASADLFTGVHTDSSLTGNGLSSSPLGVERVDVKFASGIATGISGDSVVVSADSDYFSGYATTSYVDASVSSKLDASASGEFYPSSNPSGFLTAHQSLAGYATEAYVDSSVSSKLDTTAFSTVSGDFLTSHQSLAGYATESYVDSAVSGKLDVTASSQFLTSLPDDLAYTSDVASAVSGKMDKSESSSFYPMDSNPSGYLTAHQSLAGYATETYVDSAVSGKLDATAYDSAEFYTTSNPSGFIDAASASAIASAYQVVSATATQLNAGTAYLTSVNETPISAARAGNAANASLANSAWYDGTGRLISALPDEATVSSIASAYAESAASGKLDATAQVVTSTGSASAVMMGGTSYYASQINGLNISAQKAYVADEWMHAGDKLDASASSSFYTTANESGYVDSAYVESQVSGKQDTLTFDWDSNSAISSINGSALAGQGGGAPVVVTGTAWDPDTSAWYYTASSNLSAAERHVWTWQNGYKSDYIDHLKDDSGNRFPMMAAFLAAGAEQMYNGAFNANGRLQFSPSQSMFSADGSNVYGLSPLTYATGASMNLSAGYFRASYRGDTIFISRGPTGTIDSSNSSQIKAVRIEAHNSRGANISAYGANATGYYGDTGMKLSHSGVIVDDSGNSSNTASYVTLTTGSLLFNSAGSSDTMRQSSIPYWNEKIDGSALGWLEVND